jgi:hypothetical protein
VVDKDPPEKPQEKRRHLIDCLAYILLDQPRFIDRQRRLPPPLYDPNIVR